MLLGGYRGSDEYDDPLPAVLVPAVLEGQLGNLNAGGHVGLPHGAEAVEGLEDLADVVRRADQERRLGGGVGGFQDPHG